MTSSLAACARIQALLRRPDVRAARAGLDDEMLVEGFIPGREYAIEGVLTDGTLQTFAVFDKPDPLDGPFFEETIYVTPSALEPDACDAIVRTVADGYARSRIDARGGPCGVPLGRGRHSPSRDCGAADRRAVLERAPVRGTG